MDDLGVDRKFLNASQVKPLATVVSSYTYFADGDVLLAKITPCFENGKLGIATDLSNGIGFGSSEFTVFRPSANLDKEWLYYFLSREAFRVEGAARMTGAVGHKRVPKEFIESYPIPLPPLPDGCFALPEQPGLGLRLNHDACGAMPRTRAHFDLFQPGWEQRRPAAVQHEEPS